MAACRALPRVDRAPGTARASTTASSLWDCARRPEMLERAYWT